MGPVDPVGPCGMTSPSDLTSIGPVVPGSDPVGPVGPYIARGPVGSYGTSSPCDSDTPGPVTPTRKFPQSHQDGGECMDMHDGWSDSNVAGIPAAVAMVDLRVGSTVTDVSSNGEDDCEDWDNDYQRKILEDVSVYYDDDSIVDSVRKAWRE